MDFPDKIKKVLMLEAKCPYCGSEGAYVGATSVECTNPRCKFFKSNLKTIELVFGRGIGGPYINGKEPDGEYSIGDEGEVDGLSVGGVPITSMKFDKNIEDGETPTEVVINYGGTEIVGRLAKRVVGDPDKDVMVTLVNGEKQDLDETQLYVLFQV